MAKAKKAANAVIPKKASGALPLSAAKDAAQANPIAESNIKKGQGWAGSKTPDVEKLAKNADKFLYHSDVSKNVDQLHYGIEPQQGGPWVREIAEHATDDPEELLRNSTALSWFSDKPTWVKMKVARELNKPLSELTEEDIIKNGHLAIVNKKDPFLKDIWRVGEEGLSEGSHSKVQTLQGENIPAWHTNLYDNDYTGNKEPFGVESNEWVSTQPVEPFVQLTGIPLVDFLKKTGNYADGGMVDSPPEEAIKNTITDPQAFKMLDMDLANLALMSQQPPRRMAEGGKMSKDEDLFALKPQPKPAVPTVRELVAEIGKSPSRYEAKYPAKDFTPLELQAYRLMQAAKATPDANRYLESLNPYFDSQLKFDIGAGSDAGYVEPKVPNLAVVQQLQDIKNTIPHELTHTLQLGKGKGTELERDRQVMQRAKALPIETQKTMMPSGNRYENMKETWANINARAHEVNAAGGDFINSPEGRALFPTPEMQREYYTRSMPGVNSMTPSTGTFVANTSAPVDRSKQSYAQQALRALGFAQGGAARHPSIEEMRIEMMERGYGKA